MMSDPDAPPRTRRLRGWLIIGVVLIAAAVAGNVWLTPPPRADPPPPTPASADMATYLRLCDGKSLAAEGKHEAALAILEDVARTRVGTRYGWNADIFAALAVAHAGDVDAATARIKRCLAECPLEDQMPAARITEAEIVSLGGEHDRSVAMLERLVTELRGVSGRICGDVLFAMARAHNRAGLHGLRRAAFVRVAEDYPGNEDTARVMALRGIERVARVAEGEQADAPQRLLDATGARWVAALEGGTNVWTADSGPYIVRGTLSIAPGTTLQIEAGTEVRFTFDGALRVAGALSVTGTEGRPVRFTTLDDDPDRQWWQGLIVPRAEPAPVVGLTHAHLVGADTAIAAEAGDVTMRHCRVERAMRIGVRASGDARLHMTNVDLVASRRVAVQAEAQARPQLEQCRISEAGLHGVLLKEVGADAFVRDCAVDSCGGHGMMVRGTCAPAIDGCTIQANALDGVRSIDGASPSITGSMIAANGGAGIRLLQQWDGVVSRCRITANHDGGLRAEAACRGRVVANHLTANDVFGLYLRLASTTAIEGNRLVANHGPGLVLEDQARPRLMQANHFLDNAGAALRNHSGAPLEAAGNWWGAADADLIAAMIDDDGGQSPVNTHPWLAAPATEEGIAAGGE